KAHPVSQTPSALPVGRDGVGQRLRLRVAAFESQGVSSDRKYLVDGFRHQLISGLIRFREWVVADGGSAEPSEQETAAGEYLISGFAFDADGFMRIILNVRDEATGEYVWSEECGTSLTEWFATHRMIVRRLAVAINVQISAERVRGRTEAPHMPLNAFDQWLRGQELAKRWRPEERLRAQEIFRSIVAIAPNFAPAYCSLVNFENSRHLIFPGIYRSRSRAHEALRMAKAAVDADPTNSRGHLCAAWSFALNDLFDQAELSYQMAHELNENDPWTLISSALGSAFCGAKDLAKERVDAALKLGMTGQPLLWCYQVVCRFMCEDYEGAVWASTRSADAIYNVPAWSAAALAQLGRIDEARREARRFVELVAADRHGPAPPSDADVARWLLHSFPIRHVADWRRLRDGLRRADVPVVEERPLPLDDETAAIASASYSHSPVV
ncbi:MAG: hypothetical protein RIF44_08995, partial [Nitratireductor sp.]